MVTLNERSHRPTAIKTKVRGVNRNSKETENYKNETRLWPSPLFITMLTSSVNKLSGEDNMATLKKYMKEVKAIVSKCPNLVSFDYETLKGGHVKVYLVRNINNVSSSKFFICGATSSDVRAIKKVTTGMLRWLENREADTVTQY